MMIFTKVQPFLAGLYEQRKTGGREVQRWLPWYCVSQAWSAHRLSWAFMVLTVLSVLVATMGHSQLAM